MKFFPVKVQLYYIQELRSLVNNFTAKNGKIYSVNIHENFTLKDRYNKQLISGQLRVLIIYNYLIEHTLKQGYFHHSQKRPWLLSVCNQSRVSRPLFQRRAKSATHAHVIVPASFMRWALYNRYQIKLCALCMDLVLRRNR